MARWAEAGNGSYFDAASADALAAAIQSAVSAPFEVYTSEARGPVATGTVGGDRITLDPGTYRVEVRTDPPASFDVELGWGEVAMLELPEVSE
jgi:hypothetical protein